MSVRRSTPPARVLSAAVLAAAIAVLGLRGSAADAGTRPAELAGWGISSPLTPYSHVVCTAGFNATDATGAAVLLTAGHCGGVGSTWYSQHLGDHLIGRVSERVYQPWAGIEDWAVIRLDGAYAAPASVRFGRVDAAVVGLATPRVGMPVCMTGWASGTRCGVVTSTSTSGLIATTIDTRAGDSGSPLFARVAGSDRVRALGILSMGNGRDSWYEPLAKVLRDARLKLRTRA